MTWEDVKEFTDRYHVREFSGAAFCLFAIALGVATHWPDPPKVELVDFRPSDKLQHFVGYFTLTFLMLIMLRWSRWSFWSRLRRWKLQGLFVLAVVLLLGSIDEITQPAFGRDCSAYDLIADVCGAMTAIVLFAAFDFANDVARRFRWTGYEPLESH